MAEAPDFAAAEFYLRQAREAHEAGDDTRMAAARHLVLVALRVSLAPPVNKPR